VLYGIVASASVVVQGCADLRVALRHARLMLHQLEGQHQGPTVSVQLAARESARLNELVVRVVSKMVSIQSTKLYAGEQYLSVYDGLTVGLLDAIV
jgi:ATP-dependent protease ClpP protease subunit